jgi:hypothetical protein
VTLIVWGPSANLLTKNKELQETIAKMLEAGMKVEACLACANRYGIASKLSDMKIDVKYMGVPLTNYLKSDWNVLSF